MEATEIVTHTINNKIFKTFEEVIKYFSPKRNWFEMSNNLDIYMKEYLQEMDKIWVNKTNNSFIGENLKILLKYYQEENNYFSEDIKKFYFVVIFVYKYLKELFPKKYFLIRADREFKTNISIFGKKINETRLKKKIIVKFFPKICTYLYGLMNPSVVEKISKQKYDFDTLSHNPFIKKLEKGDIKWKKTIGKYKSSIEEGIVKTIRTKKLEVYDIT